MGARTFSIIGYGKTVQDAYNQLCKDAEEEYGHQQGYSGEINSTSINRNRTTEYKNSKLSPGDFYRKVEDSIEKRCADYIVIEEPKINTSKIKSTVTNYPQKGTRKWETVFNIEAFDGDIVTTAKSQTEAIKKARALSEKSQNRYYVYIAKKLVGGSIQVALTEYKKSAAEKQGKYLFLVCAPE